MHILLIPFLLGANVVVNETENWSYGAEFTFKGLIDMRLEYDNATMPVNINFPLICRNKNETTISCRVTNITVNTPNRTRQIDRAESRKPFEITFNEEGVESIVASSDVSEAFDVLRRLAGLFTLGVDMKKHREDFANFRDTEKTVLGECNTRYEITTVNESATFDEFPTTSEESEEHDGAPFDLQLIPLSGRSVVIEKIRTVSTCEKADIYFWYTEREEASEISMRSSHNSMYFTQSGMFRSMSVANGKLRREEMKRAAHIREAFGIQLVSIRPAEGPLPEIEDPLSFSAVVQPLDYMREHRAK